jgi:hypothetical protein
MRERRLDNDLIQRGHAGLWRGSLDLEDGLQNIGCTFSPNSGKCKIVPLDGSAFKKCSWDVHIEESGDRNVDTKRLVFRVKFGDLILEGVGTYASSALRCTSVEGSVLEGAEEPVYVGKFKLDLLMPDIPNQELQELQALHKARLDMQPRPSRFRRGAFVGKWKLFVLFSLEKEEITPVLTIELDKNGRFSSTGQEGSPGTNLSIGGSWAVVDPAVKREGVTNAKTKLNRGFGSETLQLGTHIRLRIERDRSKGLPAFQEPYSLWGKPELVSLEEELMSRSGGGSGYADSVKGNVYLGIGTREWVSAGGFRLVRDISPR